MSAFWCRYRCHLLQAHLSDCRGSHYFAESLIKFHEATSSLLHGAVFYPDNHCDSKLVALIGCLINLVDNLPKTTGWFQRQQRSHVMDLSRE